MGGLRNSCKKRSNRIENMAETMKNHGKPSKHIEETIEFEAFRCLSV